MPAPHPAEFRQRAVELARLREKPVAPTAVCGTGFARRISTRAVAATV
jgi:hypothetical protein